MTTGIKNFNKTRGFLFCLTLMSIALLPNSSAQEPNIQVTNYIRMAKAFQCSVYAHVAEDPEQHRRLRLVGIEAGRIHLEIARAGKLDDETVAFSGDQSLWGLDQHSVDLAIGFYYGTLVTKTYETLVNDDEGNFYFDDDRIARANQFFAAENCLLIN